MPISNTVPPTTSSIAAISRTVRSSTSKSLGLLRMLDEDSSDDNEVQLAQVPQPPASLKADTELDGDGGRNAFHQASSRNQSNVTFNISFSSKGVLHCGVQLVLRSNK